MKCVEYLQESTKEAKRAIKGMSDARGLTLEQVNDIKNTYEFIHLRSIAYSLAVIADKLSEEGELDDKSRSNSNAQADTGTTDN
jgi:hypothetical protein